MKWLPAIAAACLLAGCGDDGGDGGGDDGGAAADAGTADAASGPDAAASCTAPATYAAATLVQPQAESTAAKGGELESLLGAGALNADTDVLQLELYAGFGGLAGGIATGTYPITGDDTNYATCGVCVRVFTDVDAMGASAGQLLAVGGSVQVTSIEGNLTATLSGIELQQVEIDPDTFMSTPHPSGCTSAITSVELDAAIVAN